MENPTPIRHPSLGLKFFLSVNLFKSRLDKSANARESFLIAFLEHGTLPGYDKHEKYAHTKSSAYTYAYRNILSFCYKKKKFSTRCFLWKPNLVKSTCCIRRNIFKHLFFHFYQISFLKITCKRLSFPTFNHRKHKIEKKIETFKRLKLSGTLIRLMLLMEYDLKTFLFFDMLFMLLISSTNYSLTISIKLQCVLYY